MTLWYLQYSSWPQEGDVTLYVSYSFIWLIFRTGSNLFIIFFLVDHPEAKLWPNTWTTIFKTILTVCRRRANQSPRKSHLLWTARFLKFFLILRTLLHYPPYIVRCFLCCAPSLKTTFLNCSRFLAFVCLSMCMLPASRWKSGKRWKIKMSGWRGWRSVCPAS